MENIEVKFMIPTKKGDILVYGFLLYDNGTRCKVQYLWQGEMEIIIMDSNRLIKE
jgi:hypothetical protein